ncbi:MAG: putative bifunctional diguanylate cyclase/phosphodiesterase [Acidobacteriota bacterium]
MGWKWRAPAVSGTTIAALAALLEALIITALTLCGSRRGSLHVIYGLGIAGIAVLILFLAGIVLSRQSAEQRDRVSQDLLDAFLEHIPDNVFFKDRDSRFVRISRSMANYCGLTAPSQAVNKTDRDIFSSEHADHAFADEQEIIRSGNPMLAKEEKETWPDGHETWVLTTKVPLRASTGQIVGTMGIAHDITDRKQAEMRVQYMALHDALTGLPNRALLEDRLSQATALARREGKSLALLLLDIDRFKNINDSFGHYVGDRLLEEVTVRLKACLRESDTLARLAGDEFVVAAPVAPNSEDIPAMAKRLLGAVDEPFQIEGHDLQVTASIGVCQFPADAETPETLLQFADAAMYAAKQRGRGKCAFFSPALTQATRQLRQLEADLYQACERDQFVLHYQPIISTESGEITAVEALLRWRHPKQGLISPNQFIPLLEELDLMVGVGRWVMKTACHQMLEWQQSGLTTIRIAVNVSSQQFFEGNIAETIQAILRETGLNPRSLELELTESRILDDSPATINIMQKLKGIGVSLSLDDFGTGWSSLSYLRQFPIDRLKIDRSFIRDIASQPAAEAVVRSILALGHNLGIACIAEGVETGQQRECLERLHCAEMQGFLFSVPITATDCRALLHSRRFAPGSKAPRRGSRVAI